MTIGEKIKQLRELADLSIRELANKSGLAPSHLSYIEKDQVNPSIDKLTNICNALNIDLITFLSETNVKPIFTKQHLELLESTKDLTIEQLDLLKQIIEQFKN